MGGIGVTRSSCVSPIYLEIISIGKSACICLEQVVYTLLFGVINIS